ncbi:MULTISPECIES: hypothetical protein [Halomonadaceae]|uniref:hypothetical protein n=1 Tax=Halomonadaceae TaxID=28256 RepID=UPI0011BE3906|nr:MULTISPECIES: hypothetical protein [Halomonas]
MACQDGAEYAARELKALLSGWAYEISLYLFVDFDAAGFEIAKEFWVSGLSGWYAREKGGRQTQPTTD